MSTAYTMGDPAPIDKPSWDDAPEWAQALGVATWDCDYNGVWCWMCSPHSPYFDHVEPRPEKT